jgi:hypothetical protein
MGHASMSSNAAPASVYLETSAWQPPRQVNSLGIIVNSSSGQRHFPGVPAVDTTYYLLLLFLVCDRLLHSGTHTGCTSMTQDYFTSAFTHPKNRNLCVSLRVISPDCI